jgi:hypothetical protein
MSAPGLSDLLARIRHQDHKQDVYAAGDTEETTRPATATGRRDPRVNE